MTIISCINWTHNLYNVIKTIINNNCAVPVIPCNVYDCHYSPAALHVTAVYYSPVTVSSPGPLPVKAQHNNERNYHEYQRPHHHHFFITTTVTTSTSSSPLSPNVYCSPDTHTITTITTTTTTTTIDPSMSDTLQHHHYHHSDHPPPTHTHTKKSHPNPSSP